MNIVFVGSSEFIDGMKSLAQTLTKKGHTCVLPPIEMSDAEWAKVHGRDALLKKKPEFTKNHYAKITEGDAILVVNREKRGIKGYLGPNTLMEIAVAFYLDKKIFFLNPFGEDHPFYEELAGLPATILDGNIRKIE